MMPKPPHMLATPRLTGDGHFITIEMTAAAAAQLLAELRPMPRTPAVTALGKSLVGVLQGLKATSPHHQDGVTVIERHHDPDEQDKIF